MNKRIFEQARKNYLLKYIVSGGCSQCLFSEHFFANLLSVKREIREKAEDIANGGDSSCAFHAKVYNQIFGFNFPLDRNGNHCRIDCDYYIENKIDVLHSVEGCCRCLKI